MPQFVVLQLGDEWFPDLGRNQNNLDWLCDSPWYHLRLAVFYTLA